MDIEEFDALKCGDKVRSAEGRVAEVVSVANHSGQIGVRWGDDQPVFWLYRRADVYCNWHLGHQPPHSS